MKPSPLAAILSLLVFLMLAGPARAAGDDEPDQKFDRLTMDFRIDPTGARQSTFGSTETVLKDPAIESAKQASISYSTSVEKIDVIEAYTQKPDGKRLDVPKDNYQLEVNSGKDRNHPAFSDLSTMTIIFPDVAVGDKVVLKYSVTETQPMFPGKFSLLESFDRYNVYEDVRATIDVPASLDAKLGNYGMKQVRDVTKDGHRLIELGWSNPKRTKYKNPGQTLVYDPEKESGFALSNFASYQEIAAAYGARATPKAAVTPRIGKLADEVAAKAKATTPPETAKALYEWVRDNITYAGNCIGVGSVVPRDLDFVLDNKMGDCKDHATLLQALLKARGIDSTQALIDAGETYTLPLPPVVSTVNHVIDYIPSQTLFLDATSKMPFGLLSSQLAGKPVLLVDGYKEGLKTPAIVGKAQRVEMTDSFTIADDGSAKGSITGKIAGYWAGTAARHYKDIGPERLKDYGDDILKNTHYSGKLTITPGPFDEAAQTFQYRLEFEVKDFLPMKGPGAIYVFPVFVSSMLATSEAFAEVSDVSGKDFRCSGGYVGEEYRIEFPAKVQVLGTPDNVSAASKVQSYKSTYKLDGHTLTVTRTLDDTTPGPTCPPAVNDEYKQIAQQVIPDLKSQIVYK